MKNPQQAYPGGLPEYSERLMPPIDAALPRITKEQSQLNALLESGFAWEEAVSLLALREHLYDNKEMRQRMAEDYRIHFVRWLYEQGELSELNTQSPQK